MHPDVLIGSVKLKLFTSKYALWVLKILKLPSKLISDLGGKRKVPAVGAAFNLF